MPVIPVRGVGAEGINRDVPSVLLPPQQWSDGRNVRFDNASVQKITGHESFADLSGNEPEALIYWPRPVTPYYVYAHNGTVTRRDGAGNEADIATGLTTTDRDWQLSLFNGGYTLIANNGVDAPMFNSYTSTGTVLLTDLPDWPTNYVCNVIRGHNGALIAGGLQDTTEGAVEFMRGSILVSSQAAPGSVPSSWTVGSELLTTADEFELSNSSEVLDIVSYRSVALIFTADSIHSMILATARQPTRVDTLNVGKGVLTTGCTTIVEGSVFAVDRNDIYLTDGSGRIESVADQKVKDYFFSNLSSTYFDRTRVIRSDVMDEVWIMYPTTASTGECDEALIWNFKNSTWTIRDMPNSRGITYGPRVISDAYDLSTEHVVFNGYENSSTATTSDHLHVGDRTNQFNGEDFISFVERKNIDLGNLTDSEWTCLLYTSPSPRDRQKSRMPSSA